MDPQTYSLHERLPTLSAHKGLLAGVGTAVVAELSGGLVGFVTVGTLKGALSRVGALMLRELSLVGKCFITLRTGVLLLLLHFRVCRQFVARKS